jgi:hypothetical protein
MYRPRLGIPGVVWSSLILAACSGEPRRARITSDRGAEAAGSDQAPDANQGNDTQTQRDSDSRSPSHPVIATSPNTPAGDARGGCAKQTSRATRQPVYLEFAFDVSGSMGKGDKPWHDRKLKWEPVVAATKAFFEDAKSEGFSAALTFFPAADERCDRASYQAPDVSMQALPSKTFGEALEAIGKEDWRGGTPTLYVTQGIFDQIEHEQQAHPGRYALVLVTDGYPQDCDDDSISSVAELVKSHAEQTPTYVIGVQNPPLKDAPDVTSNLAEIAQAGGSGKAYLIATSDPTQTVSAFKHTIDEIRSAAVSCMVEIPDAPQGQTFDKQKVSVRYLSGTNQTALAYDADCKGPSAWHYDNPTVPQELVLCADTCKVLQDDEQAELVVDFECEPVILL